MKTGGTKVPLPKENNHQKVQVGDILQCTSSASCAYTAGETYEVYANEHGRKCLKGDDGLEDIFSMLLSTFKVVG